MVSISAPGKLMLSGEWSVLELGTPCIVMAVDKKVNVKAEENNEIVFNAKDMGINEAKAEFKEGKLFLKGLAEDEEKKLLFVKNATELTLKYLQEKGTELKNFILSTDSENTIVELSKGEKAKIGFGSSAAIVAATVAAILSLHGQEIGSMKAKEKIYKLGCAAHYFAQGKVGSAFDVAASTYGNVLVYKKFDSQWLVKEIEAGKNIKGIIEEKWKNFEAIPITLPEDLELSVAFVGYSASTKELVLKLKEFKKEKPERYKELMDSIKKVTEGLIQALKANEKEKILELIKENRKLLQTFSKESNNNLETKELGLLADIADAEGGAGKFSGAGGGDCGIAVSFDKKIAEKIKKEWQKNDLYPLEINISKKGINLEVD